MCAPSCDCLKVVTDAAAVPADDLLGKSARRPIGNLNTRAFCLLIAGYIDEQIRIPITKRQGVSNSHSIGAPSQGMVLSLKEALRQLVVNEYGSRGDVCRDGLNFAVYGASERKSTSHRIMRACEHLCVLPKGWDDGNYSAGEVQDVFDTTSALNGVMLLLREIGDLRRTAAVYRRRCMKILMVLRKGSVQENEETQSIPDEECAEDVSRQDVCDGDCNEARMSKVLVEMRKLITDALKDPYAASGKLRSALEQCCEMIQTCSSDMEVSCRHQSKKVTTNTAPVCTSDSSTSFGEETSSSSDSTVDMCTAAHAPTITITSGHVGSSGRVISTNTRSNVYAESDPDAESPENVRKKKKRPLPVLPPARLNPLSQPPQLSCNPLTGGTRQGNFLPPCIATHWGAKQQHSVERSRNRVSWETDAGARVMPRNDSVNTMAGAVSSGGTSEGKIPLSNLRETADQLIARIERAHAQKRWQRGCVDVSEAHVYYEEAHE